MGIYIALKHIWKFVKERNLVFMILVVSQVIAVTLIYFIYGIFTSYQVSKEELDIDSYVINVYFSDTERETVGELREYMPEILEQVQDRLDFFFLNAKGEGKYIGVHSSYLNGKFGFPELVQNNISIVEGRFLSEKELEDGEPVIIGDFGVVGETYELFGEKFELVGVYVLPFEDESDEIEIGYLACPNETEIIQVTFRFKELPTQTDYLTIKNVMTEVFGDCVSFDEFEVKDVEAMIAINSVMTYSVIVSIAIALDTCMLYGYLLYKRKKQTAVYALTGAKRHTIVFMNLSEIMLVSITTLFIGLVLFKTLVEEIVLRMFGHAIQIYTPATCGKLSGVYIGMIFGFTLILTVLYSRSNVVERLRR